MRLTSDYIYAREDTTARSLQEEAILREVQKTIKVPRPVEWNLSPKCKALANRCNPRFHSQVRRSMKTVCEVNGSGVTDEW